MRSIAEPRRVRCGLWLAMAVVLLLPMIGRTQSSCPIIPAGEAAAVLGGKPIQTEEAFLCQYALPGDRATLIVELQGFASHSVAQMIFTDSRRDFATKGGIVKDEPSVGQSTFSFVSPAKGGERGCGCFVLKGSGVLMVFLNEKGVSPITRSTEGIDKLRPIIRKAAGRI